MLKRCSGRQTAASIVPQRLTRSLVLGRVVITLVKASGLSRLEDFPYTRPRSVHLGRFGDDMSKFPIKPEICTIHPHAAGIDIGAESHWVSVPPERDSNPVREFGCFTGELHAMAAMAKAMWRHDCGDGINRCLLDPSLSNSRDQWI